MAQFSRMHESRHVHLPVHSSGNGALGIPQMDGVNDGEAIDLLALGRIAEYASHATVLNEGDPAKLLFRILNGRIMLSKLLPDGRRQICEILGPDNVFGITPTSRYDSTAEALTPAQIVGFERTSVNRSVPLKFMLAEQLNAQICALHDHALLLGRKSAVERVASFVLDLIPESAEKANGHEPPSLSNGHVRVPMTRLEIADYLGLTLETVSRAFSQLKRDGVLSYDRHDSVMQVNIRRLKPLTGTY